MLGFFKQHIYVQLSRDRMTVRDAKTNEIVSEAPELAISGGEKPHVLAVGSLARRHALEPGVRIVNPFSHPRSLLSDFTSAEKILQEFMRRVLGTNLVKPSPVVVMHPLGEYEGGLTQIEIRALRELALGAGASSVVVWQGSPLTNEQVSTGNFPQSGNVLN